MTVQDTGNLTQHKLDAEIASMVEESLKFRKEAIKLDAEEAKLRAEAKNLEIRTKWHGVIAVLTAGATLIGVTITLTKLFL